MVGEQLPKNERCEIDLFDQMSTSSIRRSSYIPLYLYLLFPTTPQSLIALLIILLLQQFSKYLSTHRFWYF